MGKKASHDKRISSKGLRGALARHRAQDSINQKLTKNAQIEKQTQLNKTKSMKSMKSSKRVKQTTQEKSRGYLPFDEDDTVLLIGEGDFTFAKSLIVQNFVPAENLIATSYDSRDELIAKYPEVDKTLDELVEADVKVIHNVDATNLVKTLNLTLTSKQRRAGKTRVDLFSKHGVKLNYIMFNFPHTGKGIKDQDRNIRDHQELILEYFKNCDKVFDLVNEAQLINDDFAGYKSGANINNKSDIEKNSNFGKIILTVFEGEPYNSWGIKILAKSQGYKVMKSGRFDWSMFPEYHHKRTNSTRDTTKPAAERDARLYVFEKSTTTHNNDTKGNKKRNDSDDSDDDDS
ncbi:hypothetical protein KGF56_001086 [Candida oxycetoniae]|uniref:25S rRNA (uridine-N(3))-methyltransferase BMT5-like domain-containing protein n=1 Tax=Candida oxycetoniae TaxID=497107 RepID=A0AAI9T0A6_9ASCO|nr:uncharacterized protein KGF56_001086 [Candida oxycetoniae]KAI3406244.2 hypothetical protein KGF56_001086 [Candida oxycetoniae]